MTEPTVYVSSVIDAPTRRVWPYIRDFNALPDWHPLIKESRIETGLAADQVGCVRDFRLNDGSRIREQLLALSDYDLCCVYSILESPMPLTNYVATVRLTPVTDGDRTFAEWSATFDADAEHEATLIRDISNDVFQAGFDALRARLAN